MVHRISVEEFVEKYKSEQPLLINVRKKSEFASEHIIEAINIPLNVINEHLAEIPNSLYLSKHTFVVDR